MSIYKNVINYVETSSGVEKIEENVNDILARKDNQYKGWSCWSGIHTIGIDCDGTIYNATCRDKTLGNIYRDDKINLLDKPHICGREWCVCAADLNTRKVKNKYYGKHVRDGKMRITRLDVELTSRCNLKCPFCLRTTIGTQIKDLDLSIFDKIDMNDIKFIDVCGNIGDPVCHPDFFKFIDLIKDDTLVKMSTNGSLHNKEWWGKLAKELSRTRDSFVIFALDGSEESHKKHRIGANYKQTLKNIEAFNSAGGKSYAQFITFKHNIHEVDESETLAKNLGCENLLTRTSCFYDDVFERPTESVKTRHEACEDANIIVLCKHLDRDMVFIDFEGQVFPCCFLAVYKHTKKDQEVYSLYQKHADDIDLNKRTLSEILDSEFYKYLHANYQNMEVCRSFCKFIDMDFMEIK